MITKIRTQRNRNGIFSISSKNNYLLLKNYFPRFASFAFQKRILSLLHALKRSVTFLNKSINKITKLSHEIIKNYPKALFYPLDGFFLLLLLAVWEGFVCLDGFWSQF